jgi:hypothetical protein
MKASSKRHLFLFILFHSIVQFANAQSAIIGVVKGLSNGDSAIVRIQKSGESFFFKKVGGNPSNLDVPFQFPNLTNGKWALSIDAKGYLFPMAKTLELNNNTIDNVVTLTKAPADSNFSYQWQDDSSYVGHAQQAYINDQVEINVLGMAEKVPDDFNSINLLYEFGFLLSDAVGVWTSEDAFRLSTTIRKLNFRKFGENDSVFVKAIWRITNDFIDQDLSFSTQNGVDIITISRQAFTYASPLVVTLDGVKGKFFSKRLYKAIIYYYTDKGASAHKIDEIARTRFGFDFLVPSQTLGQLMGETESNFQEFTAEEKLVILSMFEEFPEGMHRQDQLKYMVRRMNGQPNPKYTEAAAIAWVTNQNIEWMEKAFRAQDVIDVQRLILHEKAHFLWEYTFDSTSKSDWATLGGWYLDPASSSGWSTTNTTEFVSAYAHAKNPNEDMAESIAFYITNPDALRSRSLRKFEFVRDRLMKGTSYISQIRPDLTFRVYNLYPDYIYPGKIIRTKLEVIGKSDEDKKIIVEIELKQTDSLFSGAEQASTRLTSSIGTFIDLGMYPVNASKTILRGERILSKLSKSGYWIFPQIAIIDQARNIRLENNSTYGLKCFINNPLEDITPPLYVQETMKLDTLTEKFIDYGGLPASKACGTCADTLKPMKAIRIKLDIIEKNTIAPYGRIYFNVNFPTIDSTDKYNLRPYSKEIAAQSNNGLINDVADSLKKIDVLFPIRDFYPSGYYSIPYFFMQDHALNSRDVFLDKDTANKNLFLPVPLQETQRALRDSIYISTPYPDYKAPVLDLNDIQIKATPTNPVSPNGETLFEMWLWIKDESDYPGKAAGLKHGFYRLRDPQGLERTISMQKDLGNLYYDFYPDSSIYGFKRYYFNTVLPVGSPPGLWGVSSITLLDHAINTKSYNFTEIVRFDVDQSNVLQVTPHVEILDKKVNATNAEALSVRIGCKSCKDQNYRIRMYSSLGGNSVVNEGVMTADTVTLKNLKLTGVNDGILYATVFMLDSSKALIGTGRATYTKDTQVPRSQQLQTNLANFGKSNLDSLIVDIKSTEKNGTYNLSIVQSTITGAMNSNSGPLTALATSPRLGDSVVVSGTYKDGNFQIPVNVIKSMQDGLIELRFYLIDSVGNVGEMVKTTLYKDTKDPIISFKKASEMGLNTIVAMTASETVFNTVGATNLIVKNATISAVEKVDGKNYKITLTRTCADTLGLELKAAVVKDTVGNVNTVSVFQSIDAIVPSQPTVSVVSLCQGGSANPLTAVGTNGNSLQWYGTAPTGGTASGTAPTPSTTNVGTTLYYVNQKNATTQCEGLRSALEVVVHPIPNKPTISRQPDGQLLSSSPSGNQWYKEEVLIQGATSITYKPAEAAYYSVKSTINSCVSPMSDSYYLVVTALTNFSNGEYIRVSPNPIQSDGVVQFKLNGISKIDVEVVDVQGRVVIAKSNLSNGASIGFSVLKQGVYFMKISSKEKVLIHVLQLLRQ